MPDRTDKTIAHADEGNVLLSCRRCLAEGKLPTFHSLPEIAAEIMQFYVTHQRCDPLPVPKRADANA